MKLLGAIAWLRIFLYAQTRPSLHYAADLTFQTIVYGTALVPTVYLLNLFDVATQIDYKLLGHFLGPLGLGSLVAGSVRQAFPDAVTRKAWLVPSTYGGITVMTFALLISSSKPTEMPIAGIVGLVTGAASFTAIDWMQRREARGNCAA